MGSPTVYTLKNQDLEVLMWPLRVVRLFPYIPWAVEIMKAETG